MDCIEGQARMDKHSVAIYTIAYDTVTLRHTVVCAAKKAITSHYDKKHFKY